MSEGMTNSILISENTVEKCLESSPTIDSMLVADLNGNIHAMKVRDNEKDYFRGSNSTFLSQVALALQSISKILSEHLFLGDIIEEIEIVGAQKILWIKNVADIFFTQAVASARQDINELRDGIVELLLKDILSTSTAKTISLVSSDGFPIWLVGKHDLAQVATVAANVLSAVERLNIELKLGSIDFMELSDAVDEKSESKTLVLFNETQDLMLLLIEVKEDLKATKIIELGRNIFRRFIRQEYSTLVAPPSLMQEREERIKAILEETQDTTYSGNQEEELSALRNFNEASINQLEELLKELYRRYRCREVSIPYLRKRMKLPPTVINLILQSLMFEGRLGNSTIVIDPNTHVAFLRLDWSIMRKTVDYPLLKEIDEYKNQIIHRVVNRHLREYSQFFLSDLETEVKKEPKDQVKERLSEIQVLIDLIDTSEISFLSRTIRKEWQKLQELRKSSLLLEKQLERQREEQAGTESNVVLMELERRYHALQRKIQEQSILIISYKKNLDKTVKDVLGLLHRVFPHVAISFIQQRRRKQSGASALKLRLLVRCASLEHGEQCSNEIVFLSENNYNWVRLFFIQQLHRELLLKRTVSDEGFLSQAEIQIPVDVSAIKSGWEVVRSKYVEFMGDKNNEMKNADLFSILESLEQLFFTNVELNTLYKNIQESECYQEFSRCQECGFWYCVSKHFESEKEVCTFCLTKTTMS